MFTLFEESAELEAIKSALRDSARIITAALTPTKSDHTVSAHSQLYVEGNQELGHILLLRAGNVEGWVGGKLMYYLEEGDIVSPPAPGVELRTDYAIKVDICAEGSFYSALAANSKLNAQWTHHLMLGQVFFMTLARNLAREEVKFSPEIRRFSPGDTIIEQGASNDEVYTLIDGQAGVFVNGVNVGEVLPDEIFGAIAALTRSPRTATVVARTECMVLQLPREKFLDLIKARPQTVEKLVDDMAKKLVALNEKVVAFETGKL